jgi:thioredoxin reductase (NADPH)
MVRPLITTNELRAIPLFSRLSESVLDDLASCVADIHLRTGEFAVHEGEPRALLIAIEGRLEVIKEIDGVQRVIGTRTPGDLFGEVPMVLNTPFLAGLRAGETSRVVRIEPKEFHTVAAAAPEISAAVGALALDRIEGLQEIAAQPPPPELLVVGARWDAATHALRDFLQRNQVPFDWLTPDDPRAAAATAGRPQRYPIVRLKNGTMLPAPSMRELAEALGLSVVPSREEYDVVIVGAGPAGMAAAVYGASEGLRTLLIERDAPGGQAGQSSRIENYLGFPVGISGDELASRALQQAQRFGTEILVTRKVQSISSNPTRLTLDGGQVLQSRTIVLAMGVSWRRIPIPSFDPLTGRGIYYGASRSEAPSVAGQDIFLVGAGNSAGQAALFFSAYARSVTILCRGDSLAKSMSYYLLEELATKTNIRIELRSEVVAAYGDGHLEAIGVEKHESGATTRRETTGLFIFIGADTDTAWLPPEIARDGRGFVLTGADVGREQGWEAKRHPYLLESSVAGIFAAGDIRAGSVKRVAAGVGEGSMAIAFVHQYLRQPNEQEKERPKGDA